MELTKTDRYSRTTIIIMFVIMTLFILATGAPAYSVSKVPAVSMLVLLIYALVTGKYNDLPKKVITPIVISASAYIVIYIISLFYASTGKFALTVFSYYLGGISVFLLTLLLVNRNVLNTRLLLFLLAFSISIGGVFSIDAASIRILTPVLEKILSSLLGYEAITLGGFEAGTRMTSIFGVPNIFGSLAALGTLASAYLFLSAQTRKDKNISSSLLIINAVSLLYCFSLGSLIGMFFAITGLIIFAGKENRSRIVYVTLSTIVVSFISVFAGFTGMGKDGAIAFLPLVSLIIFGIVLALVLSFIDQFTIRVSAFGGKKILIIFLAILIVLSAFLIAAITLSDPYTFDTSDSTLRRSVSLEPGEYQLNIKFAGDIAATTVNIESQSYDQASMHTSSVLFNGSMKSEPIKFIVPLDSNICHINLSAEEGTTIEKITVLDNAGDVEKSVNPDYLLLPTFMANRLQGIFVNENAAQRFVFFNDGLKIAAKSPIIGLGPGAFEANIFAVQDYYYTTNSAHNHYIQTLDEVGAIGLMAFLAIIIFCIVVMVRNIRTMKNRTLYSVLFAMLIMVVIHTAIEATFSYGIYNMAAFMIFALISVEYGQREITVKESKKEAAIPTIAKSLVLVIGIILLFINLGQLAAVVSINNASNSGNVLKYMDALETGTLLDFTNDISAKTAYVNTYSKDMPRTYYKKARDYAEDMREHNSFSSLTYLVNFYIETGKSEKAYQTLNNRQKLVRYNTATWNETFDLYRSKMDEANYAEDSAEEILLVKQYAAAAYDQLDSYLAKTPNGVTLSEENELFKKSVGR